MSAPVLVFANAGRQGEHPVVDKVRLLAQHHVHGATVIEELVSDLLDEIGIRYRKRKPAPEADAFARISGKLAAVISTSPAAADVVEELIDEILKGIEKGRSVMAQAYVRVNSDEFRLLGIHCPTPNCNSDLIFDLLQAQPAEVTCQSCRKTIHGGADIVVGYKRLLERLSTAGLTAFLMAPFPKGRD